MLVTLEIAERAMRFATTVALIAAVMTFGSAPLSHAQSPQECRSLCSVDLENCRDDCVTSGGFDGCDEECGWVYEHCTNDCGGYNDAIDTDR